MRKGQKLVLCCELVIADLNPFFRFLTHYSGLPALTRHVPVTRQLKIFFFNFFSSFPLIYLIDSKSFFLFLLLHFPSSTSKLIFFDRSCYQSSDKNKFVHSHCKHNRTSYNEKPRIPKFDGEKEFFFLLTKI